MSNRLSYHPTNPSIIRQKIRKFGIVTQTLEIVSTVEKRSDRRSRVSEKVLAPPVLQIRDPSPSPDADCDPHPWAPVNHEGHNGNPFAMGNGYLPSSLSVPRPSPGSRRMSLIAPAKPGSFNSFKLAFQNVSLAAFACGCVLAGIAGYFLFLDFIKPLIWAVICGIVLYPLKREMTGLVKNWLDTLSDSSTPLVFGVVSLPVRVLDSVGDFMFSIVSSDNLIFVLLLASSIPCASIILEKEFILKVLIWVTGTIKTLDYLVLWFSSQWVLLLFCSFQCYLIAAGFCSRLKCYVLCNSVLSFIMWTLLLAYCCNFIGPLRAIGFCSCLMTILVHEFYKHGRTYLFQALFAETAGNDNEKSESSAYRPRVSSTDRRRRRRTTSINANGGSSMGWSLRANHLAAIAMDESESNKYIKWLLLACFFVYLSLHPWLLVFTAIPLAVAFAFQIPQLAVQLWHGTRSRLKNSSALIIPTWIRDVFDVWLKADKYLITYLRSSMDVVGSIVAMVLLGIGIVAVLLFIFSQLYYESLHIITLGTNTANHTLTHNVRLQQWMQRTMNVSTVSDAADRIVQKSYEGCRSWLSSKVHDIVDNSENAQLIEEQILTSLDTMLSSWMRITNFNASAVLSNSTIPTAPMFSGWNQLLDVLGSGDDDDADDLDFGVLDALRDNLLVLYSFLESVWQMLATNTQQIAGGLGEILRSVLASGSAVVDFLLDTTVFLTILFQLLCSSNEQFKPLELVQYVTPNKEVAQRISEDITDAVSVFTVSLKMSVFYGLYTWLTHMLLAVNFVFIPSVFAAILAAIPFFGPYLVSIPGALELWLVRGEPFLAVFMVVLHILPGYVVDDAIYSEIRTTHPLLTGMAIAGGMLWWGLEGVILGPVILCCILVVVSVYNNIMDDIQEL